MKVNSFTAWHFFKQIMISKAENAFKNILTVLDTGGEWGGVCGEESEKFHVHTCVYRARVRMGRRSCLKKSCFNFARARGGGDREVSCAYTCVISGFFRGTRNSSVI